MAETLRHALQAEQASGSVTVLVVDDEPDLRMLVSEILGYEGYRVFERGRR